ncbi:MAG: S41 family peptidase [Patescibacteria group bacterium]
MQDFGNPPKPKTNAGVWVAVLLFGMALAFLAGFAIGKPGSGFAATTSAVSASGTVLGLNSMPPAGTSDPADFKEFWDLWQELKSNYYQQPVSDKTLFYGAMSGLASSLGDPYTVFFDPTNAQDFNDQLQGKLSGIGAEVGEKDGQLEIIAPLPDTPAEKAGLMAGDLILDIDKKDTTNMSVDEAVSLIRGNASTTVTLTIGRIKTATDAQGKAKQTLDTKDYTITRANITVKSVSTKYLNNGTIAQITISGFDEDTSDSFKQAVTDALSKNVKGVVLDLRNDPGGYLDKATAVAGEWVGDQIVVSEKQQDKITDQYHGTGDARLKDMPTVVLVNAGSASASEIVTGALQDYGLATVVGTQTFGKGSVQNLNDFPDGSAVKITIAEWVTPKGRSINKVGLTPDVKVDRTEDDYNANRDPQLDKALQILTGKSPTAAASVSSTQSGQ